MWADAAGLGRITVYSALGQPLRAEVQVSAARDELPGMTARLAPVESFRQAGVDYSSSLMQLRFSVEKRAGGTVIKVTSDKPINDPFLDFLVELNWPAGRLVREYTFLLDPPEVAAQASRRQAVVEARTVPVLAAGTEQGEVLSKSAKPAPAAKSGGRGAEKAVPEKAQEKSTAKPAEKAEQPAGDAAAKPAPKPTGAAGEHVVKPGETLRRIATENLPTGVSLEQMLVALYRNNADAFSGKNMNRLRAGAVLQIPAQADVAAIPAEEARKVFRAQSSDWNSYRRKVASAAEAAPVAEDAGSRASSGKVSAKVEEKLPPAEQGKDQVKVSRTNKAAAGKGGVSEEDLIAKDKALKESQERLVALEKNVAELQKLLEMKNQSLAEMQKQLARKPQAGAAPVAPAVPPVSKPEEKPVAKAEVKPEAAAPKPQVEAKPEAPPPVPEPKPEVKPEAAAPQEAPKADTPADAGEVAKPVEAEAPKPVEAPKPEAPKPAVKKPAPPPPPPVEEPGFFDDMDLLPVVGGGGVLAALLGYLFIRRRKGKAQAQTDTLSQELPEPSSTLGPNSVFQTAGGQSVDTTHTTPPTTDFSQAGPGAIDTDEVDPVAEADVYMAYGRDAQAEEILLDALQKDPQRTAIHGKLLEIYANRKSVKQFETLATELYAQTGGHGPEWDKVAALGRGLDPSNPIYGGVGAAGGSAQGASAALAAAAAAVPTFDADATLVVKSPDALAALAPEPAPVYEPEPLPEPSFDFVTKTQPMTEDPLLSLPQEEEPADSGVLDFDLGGAAPAPAAPEAEADGFVDTITNADLAAEGALDFDLEAAPGEVAHRADMSATMVNPEAALEAMDFDLGTQEEAGDTGFTPEGTLVDSDVARMSGMDAQPEVAVTASEPAAAAQEPGLLDFELNVPETVAPATPELQAGLPAAKEEDMTKTQVMSLEPDEDMEFDVRLTDSTILGNPGGGGFDLSGIDLDLGGEAAASAAGAGAAGGEVPDARREEVNTKLDLAKAYEDMGDLEGARELLSEVLSEGAPDQVAQAQATLDRLSA
ncbi:FimV/HubP family polar landmark protein [Azovibrio restrictus]|uniref:FimV/HubP family polar landmark protein n=1 Tax=Azovibrio restrictus TaxID=146938 RepID=UPI0026ED91A5|nr:FimV/HubP family polar landmark protein [Azovibrio restrictus]MDD3481372.1 hypothetical protein [Azovibrio restrictus]